MIELRFHKAENCKKKLHEAYNQICLFLTFMEFSDRTLFDFCYLTFEIKLEREYTEQLFFRRFYNAALVSEFMAFLPDRTTEEVKEELDIVTLNKYRRRL